MMKENSISPNVMKGERLVSDEQLALIKLPERLQNPSIIRSSREEEVETNCFHIKFDQSITIQQYELKFFVENHFGKKSLCEGLKTDVAMEKRRSLLWRLFCQMLQNNKELFKDVFKQVYDCGCLMVSMEKLPLSSAVEILILNPDLLDEEHRASLPRKITSLTAEIKFVNEVTVDSTHLSEHSCEEQDRSSLQLLDLIFNQKIISSNSFHVFPQKSYLKNKIGQTTTKSAEIEGRIMKDGLVKSVRVCGNDSNRADLMLLADVARSVFYPDKNLIEYLLSHFNCRDIQDLEQIGKDKLKKDLKRLTFSTTHLSKNRIFVCDGIDDIPCRDRSFTIDTHDEDGHVLKKRLVCVVDYMEERYKIRINSTRLPCVYQNVKDRNGGKYKNYFPMDVLKIVSGQRVPIQKMDGRFQEKMIKSARMNPEELKSTTSDIMRAGFLTATHPYAKRFNVPLNSAAMTINASILPSPAISYAENQKEEPDNQGELFWKPSNQRKFIIGGRSRQMLVVNYRRAINDDILGEFLRNFTATLKKCGADINNDYKIINEGNFDRIKDIAINDCVDFILVVTKDKMDPIHDAFKYFEIESKIVTQHLWQQTVFNVVRKRQQMTLENLIMKTNEKLGGTNWSVRSSHAFNHANPQLKGVLENKWLGSNRLFIGINLSHSEPGTQGSIASVVGIAYTHDENLSVRGFYFFQELNQTIIKGLGRELMKPIIAYKNRSKNKQWPSHIFLYRSGVSNGEFLYVTSYEKSSVIQCFTELKKRYPDFVAPGFTFIVAQRNNGLRLMPKNIPQPKNAGQRISDADRNLKPGTIISKGIVNPSLQEFVIIAHRTLNGTCRPILYTVLADQGPNGERIPSDELQYITYSLCHLHNNFLGTINSPSVLYHAASLAKRGRNNLKMSLFGSTADDNLSSPKNSSPTSDYLSQLTEKLRTTLDSKYWA